MKSIRDIIGDRHTVAVDAHASVTDVARQMAAHHIGAVPVVDDGRLVGIFSERDILTRVVAADRNPLHTTVSEVMSSQLIVADCEGSIHAWDVTTPGVRPPERWTFHLPSGACIESTPAVWNGRLYFGARDGYVYAIGDR